jgi:hypothetical protein
MSNLVSYTKEGTQIGMFDNRVLRIFRPKRKKVAGVQRRLHKEELHNLYTSPNIIRVIKSRKMRWEHAANMGQVRNVSGTDHSADLGVGRYGLNASESGQGPVAGSCEGGNEPLC